MINMCSTLLHMVCSAVQMLKLLCMTFYIKARHLLSIIEHNCLVAMNKYPVL